MQCRITALNKRRVFFGTELDAEGSQTESEADSGTESEEGYYSMLKADSNR